MQTGLTVFVDHPEVPMDNNTAERAQRDFDANRFDSQDICREDDLYRFLDRVTASTPESRRGPVRQDSVWRH